MFCENVKQLAEILPKLNCAVLGLPADAKTPKLYSQLGLKNAVIISPDESKTSCVISVEQIRDLIAMTNSREASERFSVIDPAEAMNESAANAFLKTFEEPKPHCHFVLICKTPSSLLPTILSRAQVFYLREPGILDKPPSAKPKVMTAAKALIAANPHDLVKIANEIAKTKTKPREYALEVVATGIELLYKSYFKTNNPKFLSKLPNMLKLYDNLDQNGHLKLHLVADLC